MTAEDIIMALVVNGGNARSLALKAVEAAKDKDFEKAEELMRESGDFLGKAHEFQTQMIQDEINESKTEISMILIHGQDHLMNAMTVNDLATQMIEMYRIMYNENK